MASAVSQAPPATFSYAQAAKGRTASVAPSTTQSSQAASGTNTPSRDTTALTNASLTASQAVGEAESGKISQAEMAGSNGAKEAPPESESGSKSSQANALSSPSSPSVGATSTSTLPKEEEISFPSNSHTEGAWRQQSSSSTVNTGDRYVEASEGKRNKNKRGPGIRNNKDSEKKEVEKEKEPVKPEAPLVAAPPPTVNIWAQRIEALQKKQPVILSKAENPSINGASSAAKPSDQKRRGKTDENEKQGSTIAGKDTSKTQKKSGDVRREEPAGKRAAPRGSRVPGEKDEKSAPLPLPPSVQDAASWPTPNTVAGEEKRKVHDKTVKDDEAEDSVNKEKRPKETWTKIPFTPSAVFNTPIPSTRGRGTRGGARGGRDAGGRAGHLANGSQGGDKASMPGMPNAGNEGKEQRGRDNSSTGRTASLPPQNSKRASSDDPHGARDQRKQSVANDKAKANAPQSAKVEQTAFDLESRRPSFAHVNGGEFHPGAEFHQPPRQSRADFSQAENAFGQPAGRDRRSESNGRSVDGYNGGAGFTQQRDIRTERGGRFNRGRGNQNNFANGQSHMPGAFQNGHAMQMPNGFAARQGPYSPPLNQQQFNAAYGPPARGRGGRGQSLSYGRYNGHHMAPIQTGGPMFGYQGMDPMSAPPFNPYADQYSILTLVRAQLDYYFSIDNLCKDVYLRKHMDGQGFVFLSFIANFSRMQKLTGDLEMIRSAAENSESIELAQGEDGIDRLRVRGGYEQWILPMDQRAPTAKNNGPTKLAYPHSQRQPQSAQLPMSGASAFSPNGMEPVFQPFVPTMVPVNGHVNGIAHQHESPLSAASPNFAPGLPMSTDENYLEFETTFKDEEIENLQVVMGSPSREDKSSHAATRTYSNGSITDDYQEGRAVLTNGSSNSSSPTSVRRSRTPLSTAETNGASGNSPPVMWKKGQNDAAVVKVEADQPYPAFRAKALRHRDSTHLGQTDHHMRSLYEFWSHFLVRNFNPRMYAEFHTLALEDAYQRQTNVGMGELIKFYDEMLKNKAKVIPEPIAQHYVQLVKQETSNEDRPGFAKLRAAWRNGAIDMKSRKRIDNFVDDQLREELNSR